MKTKQFFTAVLVIATFLSLGSVSASEKTTVVQTKHDLTNQITKAFNTTPFEDLMEQPDEKITVVFKINDAHQFELIQVIGKNKDLVRYSTRILSKKIIMADPSIESKSYYMPVRFVSK